MGIGTKFLNPSRLSHFSIAGVLEPSQSRSVEQSSKSRGGTPMHVQGARGVGRFSSGSGYVAPVTLASVGF